MISSDNEMFDCRLYTPFDFDSVMLYGSKSFSNKKGKSSMLKRNGDPIEEVYSRKGLSPADIKRVNMLYECPPKNS